MAQPVTIDRLLNLVPDRPDTVLQHLSSQPDLASAQDLSGYSLLHAAASYGHLDLVRKLITDYRVDVNIADEDGDTPLAAVETVEMARLLVEDFHADLHTRNQEGQTPEEKIDSEEEFPLVAAYLREAGAGGAGAAASTIAQTGGANLSASALNGTTNGVHHPPRVPPGISDVRIGTTTEPIDDDFVPDPEFRRRIEELAARPDFQSEQGQADLRSLVQDGVSGMRDSSTQERSTRPRID